MRSREDLAAADMEAGAWWLPFLIMTTDDTSNVGALSRLPDASTTASRKATRPETT
jgi:hypothetical protein